MPRPDHRPGPSRAKPSRRLVGAAIAGAYLLAVLANFAYLYPILAAKVIPYTSWLSRMWFRSWI
jgi:dolichyl-phosphate-mannose--protein O-mannosyl transferase